MGRLKVGYGIQKGVGRLKSLRFRLVKGGTLHEEAHFSREGCYRCSKRRCTRTDVGA